MKRLACILIAVVLAGCSSKKTVGKVDMDKLVSLDSLWENLDEFTGKMVTLKFDTIYTTSTGTGGIDGWLWDVTGITIRAHGLWSNESLHRALVQAIDSTCPEEQEQCFADVGSYTVDIAYVNEKTEFPAGIRGEELLQPFAPFRDARNHEFTRFEKSGHRVLTCYVLGGKHREIRGPDRYNLLTRHIIVAPVGYQYDKKDIFLPVNWE